MIDGDDGLVKPDVEPQPSCWTCGQTTRLVAFGLFKPGMLTRPEPHEAEAEAEATTHEAEAEAEATTHEAEAEATTHEAEAEATTHEAEAKTHPEILIIIIIII